MALARVDLPAPLGPITTTISPSAAVRVQPAQDVHLGDVAAHQALRGEDDLGGGRAHAAAGSAPR